METKEQVGIKEIEKEFESVIGYKFVKKELVRICDVLCNQEYYSKLGVNMPSGLYLSGVPGVGKTLMAECFIKASKRKAFICRKDLKDVEFIEYIKQTFKNAQENAPSIVFLDDMDKFCNNDEQHKNSDVFITIQSCIDKVKGRGVFVLATINDRKTIPSSLLREGRFDSGIVVKPPRGEDLEQIVEHYIKKKKYKIEFDTKIVARILNEKSCAVLETIINEAGINAGFKRKDKIEMDDIISACLRVIYRAPEMKNIYTPEELKSIAYHEAGHVVISEVLEPGSVNLVSVRSNYGNVGGFVNYYSEDNFVNKQGLENRVIVLLGGKASTEICFGEVDVGVTLDLRNACEIIDDFVDNYCSFGFDKNVLYGINSTENKERRDLQKTIEMQRYYQIAKKILIDNREFLDKVAQALMVKDVLTSTEIQEIKASCKIVA